MRRRWRLRRLRRRQRHRTIWQNELTRWMHAYFVDVKTVARIAAGKHQHNVQWVDVNKIKEKSKTFLRHDLHYIRRHINFIFWQFRLFLLSVFRRYGYILIRRPTTLRRPKRTKYHQIEKCIFGLRRLRYACNTKTVDAGVLRGE